MKNSSKVILGVTLLEIMLVLAIAAMVIVMSVRYYKSATLSQQGNASLQQIQTIIGAAEQLAQGAGNFSGINTSDIEPLMGGSGSLDTQWGKTITLSVNAGGKLLITLPSTPSGVCQLIYAATVTRDSDHFSSGSTCSATSATSLKLTYTK